MGFKSISAFNLALLGKQAWRFINKPDMLVSRLYKARYFPNCSFSDSVIGHSPSYIWRSVWNSKVIIKEGLKWSIGSGESISLWDPNWIADGTALINMWPHDVNINNLKVADIIHPNGKTWNQGMIYSLVDVTAAQKIINTPLFSAVHTDKLVWKHESDGIFSVRSAYKACINNIIDTSHLRIKERWNLLWKIKTPPRIKNFLWRLCRDSIPTRRRLLDKGVDCQPICVGCNSDEENNYHLFFQCPKSIECWKLAGLWTLVRRISENGEIFATMIFSILQEASKDQQSVFSVTLWSIWKGRNNLVWNQESESSTNIWQRATQVLSGWREAQLALPINPSIATEGDNTRWSKPERGRFKCNIDASFSNNKVGFGACVRDDTGTFIAARTDWYSPITDVATGEAQSFLAAINWVNELGLDNIDFELDAKRVVDCIAATKPNISDFGTIVSECSRLLALFFRNSHVKFIRRQANEVAHALARVAPNYASFHVFDCIPACIYDLIINEMN